MNDDPTRATRIDYVTGRKIADTGPEANRQAVEKLLVDAKGYAKADICVDAPIVVDIAGKIYRSVVDLVVSVEGRAVMAIRCAAGSLESWEREIVAAARLLGQAPLPLAVVSDGVDAVVWDGPSGQKRGQGLSAIPDKGQFRQMLPRFQPQPLTVERREREKIIFRSYDSMKVNRAVPPDPEPGQAGTPKADRQS